MATVKDFADERTDGRTDGRTDRQTDKVITIGLHIFNVGALIIHKYIKVLLAEKN